MRSSAILKNLNNEEQEPLLDDFDDQDQGLEVVVQHEPLLHEQLNNLLHDLRDIERQVRVRERKPIGKFRIYSAACIGVVLTAITAPGVLATWLINSVYPSLDTLQQQAEQELRELERLEKECNRVSAEISAEGASYREQLFGYLKAHYESWWSHDECTHFVGYEPHQVDFTKMNWLSRGGQFFCSFKEWLPTDDFPTEQEVEACYPIAAAGCDETQKHANLTQALAAIDQRALSSFAQGRDYWSAQQTIKNRMMWGFPNEAFSFANGGWQITLASIGAASILSIALYKLISECRGHRARMANWFRLINALPREFYQSDEFKNLVQRVDVAANDNKVLTDLSEELQEHSDASRLRHERRQMFFRGALPRNAGTPLHAFFHSSAGRTKDIKAMILEHADLLPVMRKP